MEKLILRECAKEDSIYKPPVGGRPKLDIIPGKVRLTKEKEGMSNCGLARAYGVSEATIRRRLKEAEEKRKDEERQQKQMECKIRNVEEDVLLKLDRLARKHNMSRNKYLKGVLTNHVLSGELKEQEEKYCVLMETVLEVVQHNSELIEKVRQETTMVMEEVLREIGRKDRG